MFFFLISILLSTFSLADVLEAPSVLIDFEQNPTHVEWKKIDTKNFEVIFPREIEKEAQRVSHFLEAAYPIVTRSLESPPTKISLILQNQSTVSNGFVTLAPRRSEFYITPSIDPELTNTEWLKTLSIHEFRHIVQFQKSRRGFNKFFEALLGEYGQALGIGFTMPPWFLEGDAVGIETALTKGGRGRLPLFERDLKALLLSDRKYNYEKSHLGSFKNYLPSHYVFGYFYTSYLINRHGDLFSSRLINKSASRSYNPLSFYNAYADLTGEKFEKFYSQVMAELKKNWLEKEASLSLTPYEVKNLPMEADWTNYLYPQAVGTDSFLALKKGLSDINQFVLIEGKKERTLVYPGSLQNEYPYKVRNSRFAWVELELDPRWGYRDFAAIKVFDLKKNKIIGELGKTKARLAVLDPSGEFLLYINWDEKQGQHIVVSDLQGQILKRLNFPQERVITSLDWITPTEIVLVVRDFDDQKEVIQFSLETQKQTPLLPPSTSNLGFVTVEEGRILIESPRSGIDNIFELKNQALSQLTSSRFGAYAPAVINDQLVYNDYTARGMNVVSKKLPWDTEQKSEGSFVPVYEKIALSEGAGKLDLNFFKQENFPVSDYSQTKNAVNFHSWILYAPPLSSVASIQLISRDVLNKFALTTGVDYDLNEREFEGFVSAAWSHYYPVFDLRAAYGGRNQTIELPTGRETDHWEEGTFETGVQIPWKKISGRFTHSFAARAFGKLIKVTNKNLAKSDEVSNGALFSPGVSANYNYSSRLAPRDLNPEWGTRLSAHLEEGTDITGDDMKGSLLSVDSRHYFPGFKKHHSFFHQLGYEKQRDKSYQYTSLLLKPRGTSNLFVEDALKYSGNYLFPVAYPDWNLSRYAYLKRVSLNLFFDELRSPDYHASSTGWEVLLDTNFLRIFVPFTIGVRGSYVLDGFEKGSNYEVFVTTIGGYF